MTSLLYEENPFSSLLNFANPLVFFFGGGGGREGKFAFLSLRAILDISGSPTAKRANKMMPNVRC